MKSTVIAIGLALGFAVLPVRAENGVAYTLDIAPQSIETALMEFSKQTGLQLVMPTGALPVHTTPAVNGRMELQAALTLLLSDTALTYKLVGNRTVTIVPPDRGAGAGSESGSLRVARRGSDSPAPSEGEGQGEDQKSSASPEAEKGKISEVIVTAQRRLEKLEDVPIAISVFSGEELDMSTDASVNDTLFSVPGVNLTTGTIGGVANVTIRGVAPLLGSNTVGYYIDGVPFGFVGASFSPDPGPFDLDRVEVLRGPQGTLYGAGSFSGVVRIMTHEADLDDYEFKTRTMVSSVEGGGPSFGASGVVNLPLVPGKLAARLMLNYDHTGGYVDNLVADEINDGELTSGRLTINAQPTEELSLRLGYWGSRSEQGSLPMSEPGTDFYPGDLNPGKIDEFDVFSGTATYDFGSFTATNTVSYLDYFNQSIVDWSAWHNTYTGPCPSAQCTDLDGLFYYEQASEVFTNEFNLSSESGGSWTWSAGAIYRDAEDLITNHWDALPNPFPSSQSESTSYAVYGELTRSFADGALELTGGLRYFHDKVRQSEPGGTYDVTSSFEHVSPRIVLTWRPDDDMTIYASYAQGFRSGLNQPAYTEALTPGLPPLNEDTLDNYEIGSKGNLFDGLLNYEVAAYYMHWEGVQQGLCQEIIIDGIPSCANAYLNAGTADGPGVDVALTLRPADEFSIGLTGSWNDLVFSEPVSFGPSILYNEGDRLAGSAEYTFGGFFNYRAPLGSTELEWGFSGSVNYKSAVDTVFVGTSVAIPGRRSGDSITDARLGLEISNPDAWTLEIFADNVLDERGVALPAARPGDFYVTRWVPRTIGAQFSVHF